jgi:hypothetical protein
MKTGFFRQAKDLKLTKEKIQAMLYVRQWCCGPQAVPLAPTP